MKLNITNEFELEYLGEKEEYVYDIEVEENHNFFANNILVHNSNYLCLDEIKRNYAPEMPLIEFCHKMEDIFQDFYDKILQIWANKYGVEQIIKFKREDIISKLLVLAKKKYIKLVLQSEDEIYDSPKLKAIGGEIVKSDVPKLCREMIKETVNVLFKGDVPDKDAVNKHLKRVKKNYKMEKKEEISFNKSVSEYTKYAEPTSFYVKNGGVVIKKGTPIHTKASMYYNYMVEKYNLPYMQINNGMKLKFVYINPNNILGTKVIAFVGNWPKEFDKYFTIDYKVQFQKSFLNAIQNIFDVMKWGEINLRAGGLNKFTKKRKKRV
jgi:DNA polymerase elongation subunit (family B)